MPVAQGGPGRRACVAAVRVKCRVPLALLHKPHRAGLLSLFAKQALSEPRKSVVEDDTGPPNRHLFIVKHQDTEMRPSRSQEGVALSSDKRHLITGKRSHTENVYVIYSCVTARD